MPPKWMIISAALTLIARLIRPMKLRKTDFVTSQTLASEEALTNSAREMLLLRSDSWSDYWKTVSAYYSTVSSMPQDKKNEWKTFFETENGWLSYSQAEVSLTKRHEEDC
jgi:D-alanyl-D-alanine carboxypeptidase